MITATKAECVTIMLSSIVISVVCATATLIIYKLFVEEFLAAFWRSRHIRKLTTKFSRALLEFFIDVRNDVFCHLEALCESEGEWEEEFDLYMDSPITTQSDKLGSFDQFPERMKEEALHNFHIPCAGPSPSGRGGNVIGRRVLVSLPIRKRLPRRRFSRRVEIEQARQQLAREQVELEELLQEIQRVRSEQQEADVQLEQVGKQLQQLRMMQRRLRE